jgi:type VI secretion system protein ImpA
MESPAVLAVEALLEAIPNGPPEGVRPDPTLENPLKDLREFKPYDDPPRDPDWAGVVQTATRILETNSKDLRVASRLVEGLAKLHGFAGVRDGLQLLRRLVEECWDRLYPSWKKLDKPEEEKTEEEKAEEEQERKDVMEVRAAAFTFLDEPDSRIAFPSTIRSIPLLRDDTRSYSWHDWHLAQERKGDIPWEQFPDIIAGTPSLDLEQAASDIQKCQAELTQLRTALARLWENEPGERPGLAQVGQALEDCNRLVQNILKEKRPLPDGKPDSSVETGGGRAPTGDGARSVQPPGTRDEVYRQLAQAAAVLRTMEPHSPVPYLIQRAVKLRDLPFPQLLKALIREQTVLEAMSRAFWLEEDSAAPPEGAPSEG